MGYVTGSCSNHCGCSWRGYFGHAILASPCHRLAIRLLADLAILLTWLNVFPGASNLNANFPPEHLAHIKSFLRSTPMNLLFPFSVTASAIFAVPMTQRAVFCGDDTFNAAGYGLLATMMVLTVLKHWFLVLPISATRICNARRQWRLVSRGGSTNASQALQRPLPISTEATIGGHI